MSKNNQSQITIISSKFLVLINQACVSYGWQAMGMSPFQRTQTTRHHCRVFRMQWNVLHTNDDRPPFSASR